MWLILGVLAAVPSGVRPCDVPVFRYALDFWPAALYELVILHQGPLLPAEQELIAKLETESPSECNLGVRLADLSLQDDASFEQLWNNAGNPALPCMILLYPPELQVEGVVWSGPLSQQNVQALLDSPARQTIAERLLEGQSAVWLLLEAADPEKDAPAKALLESRLKELEQLLELPEGAEDVLFEMVGAPESFGPPLQVRFSTLGLSRADPAESILVAMLLRSEPDLLQWESEPIAFPVFGRGRALFAFVGKGINEGNIDEACAFLTDACSCQAKEMNPGIDLLMSVNWDEELENYEAPAEADAAVQTAPSMPTAPTPERPSPPAAPGASKVQAQPPAPRLASLLLRNAALILGPIVVAVVALGLFIVKRGAKGRP